MVEYNPLMPEVFEDPLPIYARLRAEAPAYFVEEFDCWALSRFEDIWVQSGDNESYSAALRGTTPAHLITKQMPVFPSVNMMDPPEHVRNRALISRRVQAEARGGAGARRSRRSSSGTRRCSSTDDEVDLAVDYIATGGDRGVVRRCWACPIEDAPDALQLREPLLPRARTGSRRDDGRTAWPAMAELELAPVPRSPSSSSTDRKHPLDATTC